MHNREDRSQNVTENTDSCTLTNVDGVSITDVVQDLVVVQTDVGNGGVGIDIGLIDSFFSNHCY